MSFKNQSVFSATYTNTTFTVTEEMGVSSITVNLVSGSATLYGDLQFPGLTNSTVALTSGQPVVLTANKGYTLTGIIVDSTAGGVFQVYTIYQALDGTRPVNTLAPVISGATSLGSVLTTTDGTWTGTTPLTYTYQWQRNGSNITGETSSTYTIAVADSGANITCIVTATNFIGSASATSNTITAQTFAAPVNTVAPAISGTGVVGQTLTTTTGTWTGNPIPTYTYQWQRNGLPISGATSLTYVLVSADAGTNVRCVVTATNAIGAASANSNAIAVISFEQSLINAFKTRVQNDGGTYEAESCQLAQLTALNAIA